MFWNFVVSPFCSTVSPLGTNKKKTLNLEGFQISDLKSVQLHFKVKTERAIKPSPVTNPCLPASNSQNAAPDHRIALELLDLCFIMHDFCLAALSATDRSSTESFNAVDM